jgi:hypothetical protein
MMMMTLVLEFDQDLRSAGRLSTTATTGDTTGAATADTVFVTPDTAPVTPDKSPGSAAGTGEAMAVRVRPRTLRMV